MTPADNTLHISDVNIFENKWNSFKDSLMSRPTEDRHLICNLIMSKHIENNYLPHISIIMSTMPDVIISWKLIRDHRERLVNDEELVNRLFPISIKLSVEQFDEIINFPDVLMLVMKSKTLVDNEGIEFAKRAIDMNKIEALKVIVQVCDASVSDYVLQYGVKNDRLDVVHSIIEHIK